ncbi:MAG: hypothetical protein KF886_24045 [Candidatus Hydrogenedentes bacterium]|nr:hypothetical protein [Candidatus Hydrogenedentota bacterium]
MEMTWQAFKAVMKEVLHEEMGAGRHFIAKKFDGGMLVLKPADPAHQAKEIPIDVFFKKITSVREKLRVLEQKLNNHAGLSESEKAELQLYITRAYGSLTTFNVLFKEDDDKFVGAKG